jgi:hypothetical protein
MGSAFRGCMLGQGWGTKVELTFMDMWLCRDSMSFSDVLLITPLDVLGHARKDILEKLKVVVVEMKNDPMVIPRVRDALEYLLDPSLALW